MEEYIDDFIRLAEERKAIVDKIIETNSFTKFEDVTYEVFEIHDNGSLPFRVIVNDIGIRIYERKEKRPFRTIQKYEGYWYGFDDSHEEEHGNTILVKISPNKYVFIGPIVYYFETDDEIIDYVSTLGNNDVPYPIAFGKNYLYFMIEKHYVSKNSFDIESKISNASDLYMEYYDNKKLMKNDVRNAKIIHERMW